MTSVPGPVPKSPHKKKTVLRPITIPTSQPAPLVPEPSTDATAGELIPPVETSTPYTEVLTPGGGSALIADVRNLRAHQAQSKENQNQGKKTNITIEFSSSSIIKLLAHVIVKTFVDMHCIYNITMPTLIDAKVYQLIWANNQQHVAYNVLWLPIGTNK